MYISQIVDTWNINNRINLYVLDAIADDHLSSVMVSKGRNVGEQFAHMHNVRLMWIKAAMPEMLTEQTKVEKDQARNKGLLNTALRDSGEAIVKVLENAALNGGRVKGFKPHMTGFLGYMLAHDAHHRSQVIIALKQSGHPLDKKTLYGIWEWGSR